ncbi:TatD family hydrolase [Lentisphaera profundi]|uniref:TatD family hydrolase n=1 Tax=Lentisphaera profundi TaxID=1658616 RepID=A0ABY7VP50_9BACT|nr:TatD family hydrolase [Lentisphaera profundi]WDE95931.1 TatD family hydrolase [Lentisphaera profundi]
MIDICVNWFKAPFDKDREDILSRAQDAGITHIFSTGSTVENSQQSAEIAKLRPELFSATAGIHPHYASSWNKNSQDAIEQLLQLDVVRALGECGLDFNRNFSSPEEQIFAFEQQIELAIKYQKPLFMHQRDAHDSFIKIIKEKRKDFTKGVVHCFTGTEEELDDYLELDLHIGLTGWICDERRGFHMHDFIPKIPLSRLMIETDAPYLSPRTMKPRIHRNEPAFLVHLVQQLADIYGCSFAEVAKQTEQTTKPFYNLD